MDRELTPVRTILGTLPGGSPSEVASGKGDTTYTLHLDEDAYASVLRFVTRRGDRKDRGFYHRASIDGVSQWEKGRYNPDSWRLLTAGDHVVEIDGGKYSWSIGVTSDPVSAPAPVPEPNAGLWLAMAAGACGLLRRRRRR